MKIKKVGFVGASHLGICSALAAAHKNFDVVLYDNNQKRLENLEKSKVDFFEPNIEKFLRKNSKNLCLTNKLEQLKKCDLVYISHDTPTDKKNISNFVFLNKLIKKVIKHLKKKTILVVLSQAYPGFTDKINWNKGQLFYQVETLIFGNAINRAINPEQIIIGESFKNNKNSKKLLESFIKKFSKNITYMDYKSSELSKIAINLYLSSAITYTNSMAELCEKIGTKWSYIEEILRRDRRIGNYAYLKPGLGILSGNLQRDLVTSQKIFKASKCKSNLIENFIKLSNQRKKWILDILKKETKNKKFVIGIFGSTYKENISTLKNSPMIDIIENFPKQNFIIFDPVNDLNLKYKNSKISKNFNEFLKFSDILIFLTPWSFIKNKSNQQKLKKIKSRLLIDPYNIIDDKYINLLKVKKLVMGKKI